MNKLKKLMFGFFMVLGCFITTQAQVGTSTVGGTELAKLEQDFSNLLLQRLTEFSKPLVTALKPAVIELLTSTSKQVLTTLIQSQTVIDPEIFKILEDPIKKLISLTTNLLPQLSQLPATSVDDFFTQLDDLKDELFGHLKTLDLAPGSRADLAIKKLLTSLGSLDKAMQLFQGDIVSELKKRLVKIQEPISTAATKLLAGLPPETVERLLEPLKKFQGDIAKSLEVELEAFKKVIVEKLPQKLVDAIKLRTTLLLDKIKEDPNIIAKKFHRTAELIKERSKILTRSLKDIATNKGEVAQMRRDLDDIGSNMKREKSQELEPIVNDLKNDLNLVQQMLTPTKETDVKTKTAQIVQEEGIPVEGKSSAGSGILSNVFATFKKLESKVSQKSSDLIERLMGEKVIDPKPGEKPSPIFSELSEGTIIALRSGPKSPGQGRYLCVTEKGMLKPSDKTKKEIACQFTVVRLGNYLGLQSRTAGEKYMQCDPATGEIKFVGKDFYSETAEWEHFIPVGNRIDKVYFKNRKTGGYLSVRDSSEDWSQGGCVMARDSNNKPAEPTTWSKFSIEIVRHPDEPLAQTTATLGLLPAGTLVAIKSLKDPARPRYLEVYVNPSKNELQYKYFVKATGTDSNNPTCQFYIMRRDNWVGFKWRDWRSLCAEPGTHRVKFIDRSDLFASSLEHWELHPEKEGSLTGWIQSRSTGGYLTDPDGEWTRDFLWTAFAMVKNPLAKQVKGVAQFKMEPAGRGDNGLFEIEIIKQLPADVIGGGSTFTFIPAHHGKNEVQFHKNWKFPAGDLELVLKDVNAENNVYINLSPVMGKSSESLRILLGRENNTSSSIRRGDDILVDEKDKDGSVITSPAAFWVRLKEGVLSVGKGTEFGTNVITEVSFGKERTGDLIYLGLGGSIYPVSFGSIQMNKALEEKPVVVPVSAPQPEESTVISPAPQPEPEPLAVQEPVLQKPVLQEPVPRIVEEVPQVPVVAPKVIPVAPRVPAKRVVKKPARKKRKKPARKKPVAKKHVTKKKKKTRKAVKQKLDASTGKTFIQGSQAAHKDADQAAREKRVRARRRKEASAKKKKPARKKAKVKKKKNKKKKS